MPESMSVRIVDRFIIPDGNVTIEKARVPLGTIKKDRQTLNIERSSFAVYNCTFSKDVSEDITVFIDELDDYKEITTYKKAFDFNIYYSSKDHLLFSDANTPVTKAFLKALRETDGVDITFSTPHFDFDKISNQFQQTKGIRFSTTDQGVSAKAMSGSSVDSNQEAVDALQNDDATQIIGALDIGNHGYTIMLTQSGTIVCFSKLFEYNKLEHPMLSFSLDVLKKVQFLS